MWLEVSGGQRWILLLKSWQGKLGRVCWLKCWGRWDGIIKCIAGSRGGKVNMKKSLLKSRTILQLEESIKCHGDSAVEEFLCYLKENGTPIIEELENDTENDLVTFIYKGTRDAKVSCLYLI